MNGPPARRSWFEVRWRQLRNPPPPILRAVLVNLGLALIGGVVLLGYDLTQPQADLTAPIAGFIVTVLVLGSALTYAWVELPTGASGVRRRSGWAAVLGLFAGLPICYLVLVVVFQIVRPLLG